MTFRHEYICLRGLSDTFRLLHISDIHFSRYTSHMHNRRVAAEILQCCAEQNPNGIAVTGDIVSRNIDKIDFSYAYALLHCLRRIAPVYYSLGNHETDLPQHLYAEYIRECKHIGIYVLHNSFLLRKNLCFAGLTLPAEVYKNPCGGYRHLAPVTKSMILKQLGAKPIYHPCVLLAHSPMGFPAYADWGADVVLSGHVHGGVVRVPYVGGILSPERKFFPHYTKGIYRQNHAVMHVSAGIGKLRLHNPAEIICIDLLPA